MFGFEVCFSFRLDRCVIKCTTTGDFCRDVQDPNFMETSQCADAVRESWSNDCVPHSRWRARSCGSALMEPAAMPVYYST